MPKLNFEKSGGLVPAIVQDVKSGKVLMLAYMDKQAWEMTLHTGQATYFSRSRQKIWIKGETSGRRQYIKEIWIDCDDDTVLLKVEQLGGAACHTGYKSCFFKKVEKGMVHIIGEPDFDPKEVYGK